MACKLLSLTRCTEAPSSTFDDPSAWPRPCALAAGCGKHTGAPEARADELPKTGKSPASPKRSLPVGHVPELADGVLTIWPVGDSITEGVEGGFRNDLYKSYTDRGIKVDYVGTLRDSSTRVPDQDHEGHPGFTIANARENLDEWLPKAEKADVVLVLLGTNDFAWWTNRGPESHLEELFGLIDDLSKKLPKAKILVATIPPQSSAVIESLKLDRQVLARKYDAMLRSSSPNAKATAGACSSWTSSESWRCPISTTGSTRPAPRTRRSR